MVFSSLIFLYLFLPIFLISYFIIQNREWKNLCLLLFSLLFYAYGEPIYSLLMIFSIVVNYFLALFMNKKNNSKLLLTIDIIFNIGLLLIFKYFDFFITNINMITGLSINFLRLSLPIGISFYTFQILTYVIDVYRGDVEVQKNIISLGCYICAFPQLIAGPIVRYSTVNKDLKNRVENISDFANGLRRFIIGLSKKVLIANGVAYICDNLLGIGLTGIGFFGAVLIAISYTVQIYFDFSGYSDMAIGLGTMLGFKYLENFDNPYLAISITDFWRRWHISLSSFFRDYVYIPLGGNRVSVIKQIRNIIIIWLLTGLWHGASWNFVIWGLYYGSLLIIEKFILKNKIEKIPVLLRRIFTMLFVVFGWIIFLCVDLNTLKEMLNCFSFKYGFGNINIIISTQVLTLRYLIPLIAGVILSFIRLDNNKKVNDIVYILLFILSTIFILVDSYNPFIYFRF